LKPFRFTAVLSIKQILCGGCQLRILWLKYFTNEIGLLRWQSNPNVFQDMPYDMSYDTTLEKSYEHP
jgi:hypothetical protein